MRCGVVCDSVGLDALAGPFDTEDEWVEWMSPIATFTLAGDPDLKAKRLDVSFDGATVSVDVPFPSPMLEVVGVLIYDHETDSLWHANADWMNGYRDPRFFDDFVRNFSPELIAEASA